jgi:hypothetical protein
MGIQMIGVSTLVSDYPSLIMKKFFEKGMNKTAGYRMKPLLPSENSELKEISITPISATKIYYNNRSEISLLPPCQIRMKFYCCSTDM